MTRTEIVAVVEPMLGAHAPELRKLALEGAERLSQILHPSDLLVYDNYNAVAMGWSFTGKTGDTCVCLPVFSKHILLGFNRGVDLDDPEGRLEGDGKVFRRMRFSSLEVLEDPYVMALISQAVMQAKKGECGGRVVMKSESAKKRRPS